MQPDAARLWGQFGAAIDMLGRAIAACPDTLWVRGREPEFWYLAYHTLFWLDYYLSDTAEGFAPPAPFTLDELDPAGRRPATPYARAELLAYLDHGRRKCRETLARLTPERAARPAPFDWLAMSAGEVHLYNLRHVQHGAAQLNLLLRQATDTAPAWVTRGGEG